MGTPDESEACRSIHFSLMQKGKTMFLKVSYENVSDMLLAQRAWQQLQTDCVVLSDIDSARSAAEALGALDAGQGSVYDETVASALRCIKPPEWHKNGATLRLPESHPNASQLLAAISKEFECCVRRQLKAAEESAPAAPATPLPQVHAVQSASPLPAPEKTPVPPHTLPSALRSNDRVATNRMKSPLTTTVSVSLPPGVSLKQEGAAVYFAALPCDRGTMLQVAGPSWRRMVCHLQPRALVERWCKWDQAFHVKGARDDVVHTVNMLYEEIQRFKHGAGSRFAQNGTSDGEDFAIPHG
jgi:hypothetical protein